VLQLSEDGALQTGMHRAEEAAKGTTKEGRSQRKERIYEYPSTSHKWLVNPIRIFP